MDVAFPANGGRIPQHARHGFDGSNHVAPCFPFVREFAEFLKGLRGEHGAGPSAEILGGERTASDFFEVFIYFRRSHIHRPAILIEVSEELLAWQVFTTADDLCEPGIFDIDHMVLPGFSAEREGELLPAHGDMAVAHGGKSEGMVRSGVFIAADPDEGGLQQPGDGGEHFFPRQALARQIALHASANLRQGVAEGDHITVLCGVALGAPVLMVSILLPPSRVPASGLQVAICAGTDPDILPGGGDDQPLQTDQRIPIANLAPLCVVKFEILPGFLPANAGSSVAGIAKARLFCGSNGLVFRFLSGFHEKNEGRLRIL